MEDGVIATIDYNDIPPSQRNRFYEKGSMLEFLLVGIDSSTATLVGSRSDPAYVVKLLERKVPAILSGGVLVKGVSRIPGVMTKIAVDAPAGYADPVSSCVGRRGAVIKTLSNDLLGERVDIVRWFDDPAQFVLNVLGLNGHQKLNGFDDCAVSMCFDEDIGRVQIILSDDKYFDMSNFSSNNVALAEEITGWNIMLQKENDFKMEEADVLRGRAEYFIASLGIDAGLAGVLAREGFSDIADIEHLSDKEMLEINEIDEGVLLMLRKQLDEAFLVREIAMRAEKDSAISLLMTVPGLEKKDANLLYSASILSPENLADLSTYDLLDVVNLPPEHAADIIMSARRLLNYV